MSITSSNAVFTLLVPAVFATPQLVQQFATDDAFASDLVDLGEMVLGVDGVASFAFIPFLTPSTIALQANSPSIGIFEAWVAAEVSAGEKYPASGVIVMPGINKTFSLTNGGLMKHTPFPSAKKVLQPVHYQIVWNFVTPSNI
jgi:hypothetical protein